ncbi:MULTISPECIES: MiaB/RimO family radical SAM methylthiotransferase [Pseudonocardia]|uniref:Ribosomal protein uS12 methylthiotransferase RimO n=2 Tax=Pseudonocardia TaxID=1847 RepID=A0A1Y2N1I8_PSEAH|nr:MULTISPECIES: radical SAM protein [Pseudonocardia]OSY41325.1 Ribosomal protein S12 methylthiotransferase RimO [Pseudonocardia autotrophica]TDN76781.1 SSU ribosomal protein S12P methylthiotransferase [Pseudonocardia autotrophica]BBG00782.1 ribosomal protein S12 methylthiotransferase RimO [Pseudonocardia autotrophica]GEC24252.1 ribosomal protein S12 methylthiotransferase RimO [Pseudonocardia saturnea]
MASPENAPRRAALLTLGCARNEVDSEELAGRLVGSGWELVDAEAGSPDVILVNTCGFVEQAKKDSIDTVLAASDVARPAGAKVVAVGCLAERYGAELAADLPEADAVLGFDAYPELADRLADVLGGHAPAPHVPVDRRTLLPISPVERPAATADVSVPGHDWVPDISAVSGAGSRMGATGSGRTRLTGGPVASLKLASGCDRRCAFCAIPSFRGSFVSRAPADVLGEAAWLATDGVRELVLVSENSTSYGKDLPGGTRALVDLLPRLGSIEGISRVRVSYLQPAEMRPDLIAAIATTPGIAPYFDLSFQHASAPVLRRMRRFGSRTDFLDLCERIRELAPEAGIRSNVIVGFPGETEEDLAELEAFLIGARLDAVGVFGYSDEDGTEAEGYDGKLDPGQVQARVARISELVDDLMVQRAEERIGSEVVLLIERSADADDPDADEPEITGRAAHQGPDADGESYVVAAADGGPEPGSLRPGDLVRCRVLDTEGVDLLVETVELLPAGAPADLAAALVAGTG